MMYGSVRYGASQTIFCLFGQFFAFLPPKNLKVNILKKWKKHLEVSSFYTSVPKIMIIWYTVPEIWHMTDVIILCYFLPFYPHNSLKNENFKKNEKKPWRYHNFTYVYQKLWLHDARFLRYGVRRMDRQTGGRTDRWKKSHIEVGAPPKNLFTLWKFRLIK